MKRKLYYLYNSDRQLAGIYTDRKLAIAFAICYSKTFKETYTVRTQKIEDAI